MAEGYYSVWAGPIFFVRWRVGVREVDTGPLLADLLSHAPPERGYCIMSVPDNLSVPDAGGRNAAKQWLFDAKPRLKSFYFVIEGDSVRQAMQRTVAYGMMFFVREFSGFVNIERTAAAALKSLVAPEPSISAEQAARWLEQARREKAAM